MESKPRSLRWIGMGVTLFLLVSSLPIIQFYRSFWPQVSRLPTLVRQRDAGQWTPLHAVSPWVTRSLIATEDRTFDSNIGISFEGIGRSLLVDLHSGQLQEGGSTLTQQLVRDTLLSPVKRFRRKISEALLAMAVTALYSKSQILSMYLNEVYLGGGAYGIGKASQQYFHVAPKDLTPAQATLLAGLPQDPSADDPLVHRALARRRQWEVLQSMVADNVIGEASARRIYREPLNLVTQDGERAETR